VRSGKSVEWQLEGGGKMNVHICTVELLIIEAAEAETPDEDSVSSLVHRTLEKNGISGWHSLEISQFSLYGKRLIMAVPVKVFIPGFMARLIEEIS